jgi:hypothetical protein
MVKKANINKIVTEPANKIRAQTSLIGNQGYIFQLNSFFYSIMFAVLYLGQDIHNMK